MFADPLSNLMLIILLFFAGLLVMFIFILRSLELNAQNQEEISRQVAISLTDLERKVSELTFAIKDKGLIEIEEIPAYTPVQNVPGKSLADDLNSFFERIPDTPETPGAPEGKQE